MQKPEYRARDVATLEDFLQILYNCMMHAWLFDGIILHWYDDCNLSLLPSLFATAFDPDFVLVAAVAHTLKVHH